jgi:hypothetical protein
MLSNATMPKSASSRSQNPAKPLTSSVLKKPRSSIWVPVKSTGTPIVMVEN